MKLNICGGRMPVRDGSFLEDTLVIEDGLISGVAVKSRGDARILDARGLLILPGIIDIHGDAFERQLMPRPNVFFSHILAFRETDQQMIANGITTAYHGLTYSWEPGLRSAAAARDFVQAFHEIRQHLSCDTKLHLRFETHTVDGVGEVVQWIREGKVDLLAFNDHTDCYWRELSIPKHVTVFEGRTGLTKQAYEALLTRVRSCKDAVPHAIELLACASAENSVPMASHDDETPEIRRMYHEFGCAICEFPVNRESAAAAVVMGNHVVLGAPNVVRGGSQTSRRLCAKQSITENLCTVLASDYYYPALLQSPFILARQGVMPLAEAWNLVSLNPAKAVGLSDRGEIVPGKRADLVFVDASEPTIPRVVAVMVAGDLLYASGGWAHDRYSAMCCGSDSIFSRRCA